MCNPSHHHLVAPPIHHFPQPPHIRFHLQQEKILEIWHCLTPFSLTYPGFSEISLALETGSFSRQLYKWHRIMWDVTYCYGNKDILK